MQYANIFAVHARVGSVRERRVVVVIVWRHALVQRALQVFGAPCANAGGFVRAYVGRIKCPERRFQAAPARQGLAVLGGMAMAAAADPENVLATLNVGLVLGLRAHGNRRD
jgi:hypothetical protein